MNIDGILRKIIVFVLVSIMSTGMTFCRKAIDAPSYVYKREDEYIQDINRYHEAYLLKFAERMIHHYVPILECT